MNYPIEKNIPIPPPIRPGKWSDKARQMKDGDSVRVANYREANNLCRAIKRCKMNGIQRKVVEGGVRVWARKRINFTAL